MGDVNTEIIDRLVLLNREFYQTFAGSFSSTRYQVQPGVKRMLKGIASAGNVLDLGCGNGNIQRDLQEKKFSGTYWGLDFSERLLSDAQKMWGEMQPHCSFQSRFYVFDLVEPDWNRPFLKQPWDSIMAFAAFHHIPGAACRQRVFQNIRDCMLPGTQFLFSVWQPHNSPRLKKRFCAWEKVSMHEEDVEAGDILMDWRAEEGTGQKIGFRYVHIYTEEELSALAKQVHCSIVEQFYSDGAEGNLGFYQVWRIAEH